MPCGDPVVGWRAQLNWQGRARVAPGVPPAMPNANLYNAGLWIVGGLVTVDSPLYPVRVLYSLVNGSFNFTLILVYFGIYYLASIWASQVTKAVPDPYLVCLPSINTNSLLTIYRTKFFISLKLRHIAVEYLMCGIQSSQPLRACELLPILIQESTLTFSSYFISTLIGSQYSPHGCRVSSLRFHNVLALLFLLSYAIDCRGLIAVAWRRDRNEPVRKWIRDARPISADMLHTGANIALFPLLFFFSGLYYTDVLSTSVVLGMYRLFLERKGARANSAAGLVWLYPAGLISLAMRQTNIFWVAVFMGALELVRTITANKVDFTSGQPTPRTWKHVAIEKFQQYSHGNIHDIALKNAGVIGMLSFMMLGPRTNIRQTSFSARSALWSLRFSTLCSF
jgi:alpha-1,2-glucosyltransferase